MLQRIFSYLCILAFLASAVPVSAAAPALQPGRAQAFCDTATGIPASECAALAALYTSTAGPSWTNHAGWLDTPAPCSWFGVYCSGGHVNTLSLGSNNLTGSLPAQLGDLLALDSLDFDNNTLSGGLPPELAALSKLRVLSIDHSGIGGALPAQLGTLSKLQEVYLSYDGLTGPIPPEWGGLTGLKILSLINNQLSGSIPAQLGSLPELAQIFLQNNQLSGSIPPELGNLPKLIYLYLGYNQLSGTLPPQLGNIANLEHLVIGSNQLEGGIPPEFGSLAHLKVLNLMANQLFGTIPPELGSLSALTQLSLDGNQLYGDVPLAFTHLASLAAPFLDLSYNSLTASDPAVIAYLNTTDPDWASTQTVAPAGVHVSAATATTITLSWTPIAYTGDGGYYEIYKAPTAAGSYNIAGFSTDKTSTSFTVTGLDPSSTSYFVVRAFTPPHDFVMIGPDWNLHQQNAVWSNITAPLGVILGQVDPVSGGSLSYTDADGTQTAVTVPPSAVTAPVSLTFEPASTQAANPAFTFAGHAFELDAYQGGIVQPGFTFQQPILITLHYTDQDVLQVDEGQLTLDYWDSSAGQWVDAASSCSPASTYDRHPDDNWLSLPVCHLSRYGLFAPFKYRFFLPLALR